MKLIQLYLYESHMYIHTCIYYSRQQCMTVVDCIDCTCRFRYLSVLSLHQQHSCPNLLLHLLLVVTIILHRVWFFLKHPTNDPNSSFNWSRDNIYIAVILLGLGGATLMVISLSMIALLIGKYSVRLTLSLSLFLPALPPLCPYVHV